MPLRRLLVFLCALALVSAAPATAAPKLLVGASEDAAKTADPLAAKAKMDLAMLAGFDAIRMTAPGWTLGETEVAPGDILPLQNAASAAQLDGIRLLVSITTDKVSSTPLTAAARADFAAYCASIARALPSVKDLVIGNEPNLNRFWWPQFDASGGDAAARGYEAMLAATYDALKAVSPDIDVIGGAVSPRGQDDPRSQRKTHSPTTFIRDLGLAYRASGRSAPIMDTFAFHPYMEYSRTSPTFQHPRSTTVELSDYGKLVGLLSRAFDGTAQPGSKLPILYDEFGVQSQIPSGQQRAYTNLGAPSGRDAVSEQLQGAYYSQAIRIAYCQSTVIGFLIFHVSDESDLDRWQSGVYYSDDAPKSDLPQVRAAAEGARSGTLGACAPQKPIVSAPPPPAATGPSLGVWTPFAGG